ncbi:MAG: hypothetical protein GXY36_20405 [Chloroflexi bacterium]|nr:hypothetical protein [Chloroflexota bacterium]
MNQQPVVPHTALVHDSQNLPVRPPDVLYGRERVLAAISSALAAGSAVFLHGPVGIGKTALAAALTLDYAGLPGGVVWLDAHNDSTYSLLSRVARLYALDFAGNDDSAALAAQVRQVLQERRPLIVLDGQPDLAAASEFLRVCAPGVPALLTHHEESDGPWTPYAVTPLNGGDAAALLVHLIGRTLDTEQVEIVALSEALAGHPFSISVVARQLATSQLDAGDFLQRMADTPVADTSGPMRALQTAYRLLSPQLQGLVLLLGSSFSGGASAELLSDTGGAPQKVMLAAMRQLIVHGFVVERFGGEPYFAMHELVQSLAQAFLRGKHQLDSMQARHLKGLLTYVERYARENTSTGFYRLLLERPNLLAAGDYLARSGQTEQLEKLIEQLDRIDGLDIAPAPGFGPEITLLLQQLAGPDVAPGPTLGLFAPEPEPAPEPETFSTAQVEPPEQEVISLGAPEAAAEAVPPEWIPEPETFDREDLALLEQEAIPADLAYTEVEPDELPAIEPEPVETVQPVGFEPGVGADVPPTETGVPTQQMATAPPTMPEEAAGVEFEAPAETQTPVLRPFGRPSIEPALTGQAIQEYSEALEAYQADGKVEDELNALQALAALSLEQEDFERVLAYIDKGVDLAQQLHNPQREGDLLVLLGDLQVMLNRDEGAEVAYQEALQAYRPVEAWLEMALTLDKLADLYLETDRLPEAVGVLEQTLPIYDRMERPENLIDTLNKLSDTHADLLQWERALLYQQRGLELAQASGDEDAVFMQHIRLAELAEAKGDRRTAVRAYQQALGVALDLDDDALGETLYALGRLLLDDTVQLNRAAHLLEEANALLPDSTEVQRLLSRARARQERLNSAGVDLLEAASSLQGYVTADLQVSGSAR